MHGLKELEPQVWHPASVLDGVVLHMWVLPAAFMAWAVAVLIWLLFFDGD